MAIISRTSPNVNRPLAGRVAPRQHFQYICNKAMLYINIAQPRDGPSSPNLFAPTPYKPIPDIQITPIETASAQLCWANRKLL